MLKPCFTSKSVASYHPVVLLYFLGLSVTIQMISSLYLNVDKRPSQSTEPPKWNPCEYTQAKYTDSLHFASLLYLIQGHTLSAIMKNFIALSNVNFLCSTNQVHKLMPDISWFIWSAPWKCNYGQIILCICSNRQKVKIFFYSDKAIRLQAIFLTREWSGAVYSYRAQVLDAFDEGTRQPVWQWRWVE